MIAEKKEITVVNSVGNGGVPTTAGRVDPLGTFNIIQGTTDDTRTGNVIKVKTATCRLICQLPADIDAATFRYIIFKDGQTNGATPAFADVLATASTAAGYNGDNVRKVGGARFTILYDQLFCLNSHGLKADSAAVDWTRVIRLAARKLGQVRYDASAGAITDIVNGEFFILTISDSATASMNVSTQFTYQDA